MNAPAPVATPRRAVGALPSPAYIPALRSSHTLRARRAGDFTRREEHDSYQKSFERLLRDLTAGA